VNDLAGLATLARQRASARLTGVKPPMRTFRRLQLLKFPLIYEVTGPRYALNYFIIYVETRSAPVEGEIIPQNTSWLRLLANSSALERTRDQARRRRVGGAYHKEGAARGWPLSPLHANNVAALSNCRRMAPTIVSAMPQLFSHSIGSKAVVAGPVSRQHAAHATWLEADRGRSTHTRPQPSPCQRQNPPVRPADRRQYRR
jgi:hypothetical protein